MSAAPTGYPVQFTVDYPDHPLNRLTSAFRIFTVIPIAIVLGALGHYTSSSGSWENGDSAGSSTWQGASFGGLLVLAPALMIIFREKYPRWWFDFNFQLLSFINRVGAYFVLLTDVYPATDEEQVVHLVVPYPDVEAGAQPLAADRQVVPRDPALHHPLLPLHRRLLLRHRGVVRDPLHGALPEGAVRLHRGRGALEQSRDRLRLHPHDGQVPAVQHQPVRAGASR